MRFVPPVARHAGFPGYTSESQPPSPLDWDWAVERLRDAPNYWVCTTTASGAPHAMPVWAVWVDEAVCFRPAWSRSRRETSPVTRAS